MSGEFTCSVLGCVRLKRPQEAPDTTQLTVFPRAPRKNCSFCSTSRKNLAVKIFFNLKKWLNWQFLFEPRRKTAVFARPRGKTAVFVRPRGKTTLSHVLQIVFPELPDRDNHKDVSSSLSSSIRTKHIIEYYTLQRELEPTIKSISAKVSARVVENVPNKNFDATAKMSSEDESHVVPIIATFCRWRYH